MLSWSTALKSMKPRIWAPGMIPDADSVAEFRLITNSFSAEYGKFTGAVMNTVTKSGTNSFHGTLFEFYRNQKLDAINYFDTTRQS